jgi:hypothetical protein
MSGLTSERRLSYWLCRCDGTPRTKILYNNAPSRSKVKTLSTAIVWAVSPAHMNPFGFLQRGVTTGTIKSLSMASKAFILTKPTQGIDDEHILYFINVTGIAIVRSKTPTQS